jgi:Mn-dependent DtxR family transcriptional regulator
MPVHLDSHTPEIDLTPGTTKSDIVVFLYDNSEYGYKPAEIAEELDIPRGTATTTLKRLYDSGYIGKTPDSYYHALDDHEHIHRYLSSLDQLTRMFGHEAERSEPEVSGTEASDSADGTTDEAVEAEVAELEAELEE